MNSQPDANASSSSKLNENVHTTLSQVGGVSPKPNSQTIGDDKGQNRNLPTAGCDEAGRNCSVQLEAEDDFRKTNVHGGGDVPTEAEDRGQSSSLETRIEVASSSTRVLSGDDEKDNDEVNIDTNQLRHETTFPQQLMDAIEREVKDGATVNGEPILDWGEDGASFLIRDKAMFEQRVMPRHFSAKCKFMSFVRKLYRQVNSYLFVHCHSS